MRELRKQGRRAISQKPETRRSASPPGCAAAHPAPAGAGAENPPAAASVGCCGIAQLR